MVVFGASTFFSNGLFGAYGNGDLFLNSVNWTADQDKLVSIPSKPNVDRSVNLTGIVAQSVWISTIFVIPGLLLALGGFVFWRRRLA
jgi:LPXTG-motif cell wall-anchored protein